MDKYYEKYLKYKRKYLLLKEQIGGKITVGINNKKPEYSSLSIVGYLGTIEQLKQLLLDNGIVYENINKPNPIMIFINFIKDTQLFGIKKSISYITST